MSTTSFAFNNVAISTNPASPSTTPGNTLPVGAKRIYVPMFPSSGATWAAMMGTGVLTVALQRQLPDTSWLDVVRSTFDSGSVGKPGGPLTGTVSKSSGSTTVTGSGSAFTDELGIGAVLSIPGTGQPETRAVQEVVSDTQLTLSQAASRNGSNQTATRIATALFTAGVASLSGATVRLVASCTTAITIDAFVIAEV